MGGEPMESIESVMKKVKKPKAKTKPKEKLTIAVARRLGGPSVARMAARKKAPASLYTHTIHYEGPPWAPHKVRTPIPAGGN